MSNSKLTRKEYEEYLNNLNSEIQFKDFILGGKLRNGLYGKLLRKYDPIAFEVGFNDWKREKLGHL